MGNLKAFIPFLLSIVIALGGSYFLYQWIKQKTAPDKVVTVKETQAVPVVVAKANIPWGVKIQPEMLSTSPFLEESIPNGAFTRLSELSGRIVVSPIREGEPIIEYRLAPISLETGGVAAVLNSGSRAVSVKGNLVLGIAGFINPGNRVDVLVTVENPETEEKITKLVLENLLVLASGTQIIENSKGEPAPVDVYTLEVTPEQGERLTLAANEGKLQFALRGAADSDSILTKGITVPEMLKSLTLSEPEPVKPLMTGKITKAKRRIRKTRYTAPKKPRKIMVETMKGLELTKEEIKI